MESILHYPHLIIHLEPDEPLLDSLLSICLKHTVKTAVVLSGIGQLKQVTLGYFKEKDSYTPKKFEKSYELLSLTGTIINHEQSYIPHLHAIIGDQDKNTYGGHLISGTVEVTNEIIILLINETIRRKNSPKTGLMELSL